MNRSEHPEKDPVRKLEERLASRGDALSSRSMPREWDVVDVQAPRFPWYRILFNRIRTGFRRWHLARVFASFGKGSTLARPCHLYGARSISIADRVTIWWGARLVAVNHAPGRRIISIGEGTAIHPNSHVSGARMVRIGSDVLIASNCYITDHDHDWLDPAEPPRTNARIIVSPTIIGDRAWLGEKVSVLKGVTIGESSVIGANSVVTTDIPPFSVAVGSPARVVRRWDPGLGAWMRVDGP